MKMTCPIDIDTHVYVQRIHQVFDVLDKPAQQKIQKQNVLKI